MSLVTSGTIRLGHRLTVRLMAVNTVRNVAVGVSMTEVTGESCVLAWAGSHLFVRTGVTGNTDNLVLAFKSYVERLVRVVAAEAVFNFVVFTTIMAVITTWDVLRNSWTVTLMTGLAINFSFVRCTICGNLSWLLIVTLHAVRYRKDGLFGQGDRPETCNECNSTGCDQQFLHHLFPPHRNKPDISLNLQWYIMNK